MCHRHHAGIKPRAYCAIHTTLSCFFITLPWIRANNQFSACAIAINGHCAQHCAYLIIILLEHSVDSLQSRIACTCHVNTPFFVLFHIFSPATNRLRSFHLLAYKFLNGQKKPHAVCPEMNISAYTIHTHTFIFASWPCELRCRWKYFNFFFCFRSVSFPSFRRQKQHGEPARSTNAFMNQQKKNDEWKKLRWKRFSKNNVGT